VRLGQRLLAAGESVQIIQHRLRECRSSVMAFAALI
jgi:hypothetical protein